MCFDFNMKITLACFVIFVNYYRGTAGFLARDAKAKIGISPSYFNPIMSNTFRAVLNQPIMKDYLQEIGLVDHWRDNDCPNFFRAAGEDDFECQDGEGNWP